MIHAGALHGGGFSLIIGLPTETFIGVLIVPLVISLLLLAWGLRW